MLNEKMQKVSLTKNKEKENIVFNKTCIVIVVKQHAKNLSKYLG